MDTYNKQIKGIMDVMANSLVACNETQKSCVCALNVSYINDETLPEHKRYKVDGICAEKGMSIDYDKITNIIKQI